MRIAVPYWEGKISPVLDTAAKLLILETLDRKNVSRTEAFLHEQEIARRCFCIEKLGIDVLICGALSRPFAERLSAAGINVIQGISGAVDEILAAYLGGTLNRSKYWMPGCRQKQACPKKQTCLKSAKRADPAAEP